MGPAVPSGTSRRYFRIGSGMFADTSGSFGLTTPEKRHVRRQRDRVVLRFEGMSGIEHSIEIDDPEVLVALDTLRRRCGGPERLFAVGEVAEYLGDAPRSRGAPTSTRG